MNWHARSSDEAGNAFRVIFHIPITSALNRASVNYRTAVVASGRGGTTQMTTGVGAGLITAAEVTQIQAGEIYEHSELVDSNPGESAVTIRDRVDARYTALVSAVNTRLQRELTYWGFDRNVP